ncbi:type IV conjugative transfer system protein TraE [Mycetohabitans rhizoxinica]|uniref:Type IV conjugative transfer system protein TraE n=1 Tax=Mycetohabitans rhizoxinica TaxID=412963 RepID=A0ABZ2Q069_9BURK
MSPEKANNERDWLKSQVRFHRALNVGLLTALLMGVILLGFVVLRDTTKIVPPEVKRPYEISSNYANKDYLLDMADYVLAQVLTVTPDNVDYNVKTILRMAHPDGYGALKASLEAAALRMRHERVTTIWVPRKEEVNEQDLRVKVSGRLKTYIADKLTSERDKDYLVEFNVTVSGRLYVSKIEEIVKRDPSKPTGT